MVTAEFDSKHSRLAVKGHAGVAPKGEDLICAGVTALVEGLNVALEEMDTRGLLAGGDAKLEEGEAVFQAFGKEGYEMAVFGAMLTAASGLRWMAENFPEFVEMKIL